MVWMVEKKVFYHIFELGYESATIPIRVKFEFEIREGAFVPESLSFEHLYNKKVILRRYPNLKSEHLDRDIHETVKLRIREYLTQNRYLREDSGTDKIL